MKRVIEGKTYNTDTATRAAQYDYENEKGYSVTVDLYQNRGGAFFEVHTWEEDDINLGTYQRYIFETISRDGIDRLLTGRFAKGGIEVFDEKALTLAPEAEEEEPSMTIYFRLQSSLKARIEASAREAGLSINAWMLRCAERCLAPQRV